jgi:3-oxoacyl-[acyl-carrier-protein] synthase III
MMENLNAKQAKKIDLYHACGFAFALHVTN